MVGQLPPEQARDRAAQPGFSKCSWRAVRSRGTAADQGILWLLARRNVCGSARLATRRGNGDGHHLCAESSVNHEARTGDVTRFGTRQVGDHPRDFLNGAVARQCH